MNREDHAAEARRELGTVTRSGGIRKPGLQDFGPGISATAHAVLAQVELTEQLLEEIRGLREDLKSR